MSRGFSLVEVVIVAALVSLFFGGFYITIVNALNLVSDSRARMTALSIANDQIEYIRSLSYDAVGTVSGIPPGLIPQVSTTSLNQKTFTRRTLIEYIDDPADGVGASDSNGITTDYKRAKVEVSWLHKGATSTVVLVTNIIPRSLETSVGGGTVRVLVTDANIQPVSGASVRLLNTTGTTTVDVTRLTDSNGEALFGGAPAGAGYQVFVSRTGYSSDQTRLATTSLPNPSLQPIAVVEADISTLNFQIDRVSDLDVLVLEDRAEAEIVNSFLATTSVSSTTNTIVTGGGLLELASTAGVYMSTGSAFLAPLSPSPVAGWQSVVASGTTPVGTTRTLRFYTSADPSTLIPDSDLPGNSAGFLTDIVDISTLDAGTYPTIVAGVTLSTGNTVITPTLDAVTVYYVESETPDTGASFTLTGTKTIGTLADFSPVYKTVISGVTDGTGRYRAEDIEWDTYTFVRSGRDIATACPAHPLPVAPNVTIPFTVITESNSAHSLRVLVTALGQPLRNATVSLVRGSTDTAVTNSCGQVFFPSLSEATDYRLEVTHPSYPTRVIDPVTISGDEFEEVGL